MRVSTTLGAFVCEFPRRSVRDEEGGGGGGELSVSGTLPSAVPTFCMAAQFTSSHST